MPSRCISGRARRRHREAAPLAAAASEAEARDWADGLGTDLLLAILGRVDHADILMFADRVCRSWRRAARDEPTLWRRVVMRGAHAGIARRLNRGGAACEAVRRGARRCEAFCVQYAADDSFLIYLSEMAPNLKSLRLICCNDVTDEGLTEAVKELPLLEELELYLCDNVFVSGVYKVIGDACTQLKHFRLRRHCVCQWWLNLDNDYVPGIASMHRLRSLQLFSISLTSTGLETILDNCPQLESLDIRRCFTLNMAGTLLAKCAKIKKIRLPHDSIDDYEHKNVTPMSNLNQHRVVQPAFRGKYYRYFNRDACFPRLSR